MNQSGYGYGLPQGHRPPQNCPNLPHSSLPSQFSYVPAEAAPQSMQAAYQPRNMIPGLALGFASSVPEQHSPWAEQQPRRWESSSQPPQAVGHSYNHGPPGAPDSRPPAIVDAGPSTAEDGSEEGEISEGEDDDIYDAREAGHIAVANEAQAWPRAGAAQANDVSMVNSAGAPAAAGNVPSVAVHDGTTWAASQTGLVNTARERSGSYSPHLSPREIGSVDSKQALNEQGTHESSSLLGKQPMHRALSSNQVVGSPRVMAANGDKAALAPAKSIGTAKREASEAILSLWPLNIRYQTFIEEGIDGAILGGLLKDLGLEVQEDTQASQKTATNDVATLTSDSPIAFQASQASQKTATNDVATLTSDSPIAFQASQASQKTATNNVATLTSDDPIAFQASAIPSHAAPAEAAKPVDKSEERKDRIARLLAAKGSKPSPATDSPPPKAQSEKSKLLQQKMEALRKSRESLARIRSQHEASIHSMEAEAAAAENLSSPDVAEVDPNASMELTSVLEPAAQEPGSGKPSPSIPGLFLSPQLSHQDESSQQRRPTPVSSDSSARPIRRPFVQHMEPRPFLINVSDDEDDAEMEIDSPDRTSSPVNRQSTPFQKAAAFLRESSSTVNNMMPRHAVTPASAATPPRSSGNNSGGEDLANMNKKIEAMKRKIAEAEARKKTKLLRRVSPATSNLNDSSLGGSVEAAGTPRASAAQLSAERRQTSVNDPTETATAIMPAERLSCSRKASLAYRRDRRSLSTAASERLPFIEARRKEQLSRLHSLQMQMAKVEQEIAEGMREEENLKQDLVSDDSGRDESPAVPRTAPLDANCSLVGSHIAQESREPMDSEGETGTASRVEAPFAPGAGQASFMVDGVNTSSAVSENDDVVMEEADAGVKPDEESDDYEPPDADSSASQEIPSPSLQPASANEKHALPQSAEDAAKGASTSAATHSTLEAVRREDGERRQKPRLGHQAAETVVQKSQGSTSESRQARFAPYETPLQYFRAFRFHPEFGKSVAGGLRSLSYSNKIDVRKEVCPDELAGQVCPRGDGCGYQHFDNMRAPDEQILLQLGAAGNYQAEQKQEYFAGLRQLLTDFRNRKVKDFDTISRGILEHRAQFLKDRSKILPLGGVTI
ncbi:hypothetical protein G6O67_001877 [Ophiocordyceps sinensis]|uniref:C3H1-type domain-containing protein n=1 Tax=Ophiocordyceps sinensis TaxID=72228 RepID=A0A8H4V6P0_9HYPO|nr:hypothetical protein G6O67_001877 [Ophiocordyceps sinensis]